MTETIRKLSSNRWSITFISIIIGRLIMISFICWVVYYIFKKYKNNSISLKSLTNLVLIIVFVTYEFFYSYYIWHTLIIEILEQEIMLIEINKSMSRFINKNKQSSTNCEPQYKSTRSTPTPNAGLILVSPT